MKLKQSINDFLKVDPFGITKEEKRKKILEIGRLQIEYHLERCEEYACWYKKNSFKKPRQINSITDIPFVPSSAFKFLDLKSILNPVKTISSSGTSSSLKSKVFIDSSTSVNQTKSLSKILSSILDKKRKIFYIIDLEPSNSENFDSQMTARFAGMQGYLMAAKSKNYLLKKDDKGKITLDFEKLNQIPMNEAVVIIGYTYMIWEYLVSNDIFLEKNFKFPKQTKLIHFGGWKKLYNKRVNKSTLLKKINKNLSINSENVFDIYGFTEQLGTVYVSKGNLGSRPSAYSEVIVRDCETFEEVEAGKEGFLQFISILPLSYPGFSILNDDIGRITHRSMNNSKIERKEFIVSEILEKAESRGCGDTLPEDFYL